MNMRQCLYLKNGHYKSHIGIPGEIAASWWTNIRSGVQFFCLHFADVLYGWVSRIFLTVTFSTNFEIICRVQNNKKHFTAGNTTNYHIKQKKVNKRCLSLFIAKKYRQINIFRFKLDQRWSHVLCALFCSKILEKWIHKINNTRLFLIVKPL